jgi:molybdate transport repressor ModE-like protein
MAVDVKRMFLLADVARHGSITAAAHALAYTPSAVSQQIQSLEREVGLALLERHARGVRLTDAGEVVVASAEKARRLMRAVDDELAEVAGLRRGRCDWGRSRPRGRRWCRWRSPRSARTTPGSS